MTEKVLGFYEKDLPRCIDIAKNKDGEIMTWRAYKDKFPEVGLVPVVSLEDCSKEIDKALERLKGYSCGEHKQLEKQLLNWKKNVEYNSNYNKI